MTEEHKQKIQEGRKRALEERRKLGLPLRETKKTPKKNNANFVNDKPVLIYDGTETSAFEFWPKLRNLLRPLHKYELCKQIEKEIVHPSYWQNMGWVMEKLQQYVHLQLVEDETKKKKVRQPRKESTYVMTDEHKAKMKLARELKKKQK